MIGEILSRVLTKYQADASDHIKELKKLKGEQAELAKASIEAAEQSVKGYKAQLTTLGELTVGFGIMLEAGKKAADASKFAYEESRLETGAQGVAMEGLRKASAGLKSDMNLLRDAVVFNQTALRGHQGAMEDAERAMRSLTAKGNDYQKVNEAITGALTKLEVDGLRPLGINIDKAGLSMDDAADRAELFKRVMAALRAESAGVNDEQLTQQERMAASGVAFENAVDQIKKAVGDMVIALAPLVAKVAEFVALLPKIPNYAAKATAGGVKSVYQNSTVGDLGKSLFGYNSNEIYMSDMTVDGKSTWQQSDIDMLRGRQARLAEAARLIAAGQYEEGNALAEIYHVDLAHERGGGDPTSGVGAPVSGYKGKSARDTAASQAAATLKAALEAQQAQARAMFIEQAKDWIVEELAPAIVQADSDDPSSKRYADKQKADLEVMQKNFDAIFADVNKSLGGAYNDNQGVGRGGVEEALTRNQRYSDYTGHKLAAIFGPIEEFDLYKQAFDTLGGAVGSSMKAWIEGSESAGDAFKGFIGQAVEGIAVQMAMEALKHGAYALGSLAFGDIRGAAQHGQAAAAFAAGSLIAAGVARELGHGGKDYGADSKKGGGGAGANAPIGGQGGAGAPANSNQPLVLIVGDPYDTETNPRRREDNARRIVERNFGNAAGGSY
jgi:hypothetical protein